MKLALLAVGVIASLAVATASNNRALQGRPHILEATPEIPSVAPEASFGSVNGAGIDSAASALKRSTLFNDDLATAEAIGTGLGISAGSSPFGEFGYNSAIGSLTHGGSLGLIGVLGQGGLGGLGYGAGLETIHGSLLGSGGIGILQGSSGRSLRLGGDGDGVGYSSTKTYNNNYNYASDDPSIGAKKN
ncbi:uncharacterized protein [Dermacentor andersoni]|uniref:uncharacterized protein n=1 Tax=Dermacentor andersoni TaxID=34620 RepID=UPI002417BE46|nr:peroxidase-like protein 2 [Dermacentor andersoni]